MAAPGAKPKPHLAAVEFSGTAADELRLTRTPVEVSRLTRPCREERVRELLGHAHWVVGEARRVHLSHHRLVATCILFSGGNDSTVLADIFRNHADCAVHINTGIGIRETRDFVRSTCSAWSLPLVVKTPPAGDTYRDLVLDRGFPGPGQHFKMYQRLKERGLREVRRDVVRNPRAERVLFLAGRRRSESSRRAAIPMYQREGSTVWASPMALWTKLDLNTYRVMRGDVPVNQVSEILHMSGECLCGAFATKGELDEVGFWFPRMREHIQALESEIADRADIPKIRRKWGWGADRPPKPGKTPKSGALCTSCDARASGGVPITAQ